MYDLKIIYYFVNVVSNVMYSIVFYLCLKLNLEYTHVILCYNVQVGNNKYIK